MQAEAFSAQLFSVSEPKLNFDDWLHVSGPVAREALVCTSFPMATTVVLFAAKYKSLEGQTASILLLSTISLLVTVPLTIAIGS